MSTVLVIGDGPAGLSAALFLAKNGEHVVVYGQDETPMHHALLHNYLGVPDIRGSDFQAVAREQVTDQGAELREEEVLTLEIRDGRFIASTGSGETAGDYLVLAGGKPAQRLARDLGVAFVDGSAQVDTEYRTSIANVYAPGRLARPDRSQAIISAGAGATAALDILSRQAGRDVHDWDTPPEHDHDHPNL